MACQLDFDDGFGRPTWELEAEILRLTTRVMMMEREMKQMREKMALQTKRIQEVEEQWKSRLREQEEQVRLILLQKDRDMQEISTQLLVFESGLRKEQMRIEHLLQEKDAIISRQKEELHKLQCSLNSRKDDADEAIVRNGPCQDVTNVWPNLSKETVNVNSATSGSGGQIHSNVTQSRVKPKVMPKPKHLLAMKNGVIQTHNPVQMSTINSSESDTTILQSTDAKTRALKRRYVKKQRNAAQIIDGVGVVESKGW